MAFPFASQLQFGIYIAFLLPEIDPIWLGSVNSQGLSVILVVYSPPNCNLVYSNQMRKNEETLICN